MPLFYAAEKNIFEKYGIEDDVVMTPMAGTSAIQLATGQVEMGVIPYTSTIGAYTRSPTFSIVGGSGIEGLIIVGKPEIKKFAGVVKERSLAPFKRTLLEILLYDYMKKLGILL